MAPYIDAFALPIPRIHLDTYQHIAEQVAEIWKEYGALAYCEFVGDDLSMEGTRSFVDALDTTDEEVVIFGWVAFPSKEIRDDANQKVPVDPRMTDLIAPLVDPDKLIFDAGRMVYGGFRTLVEG
ncbi:MAG: DUF1428 domain-containing protein [Bacteroidota bacterium]